MGGRGGTCGRNSSPRSLKPSQEREIYIYWPRPKWRVFPFYSLSCLHSPFFFFSFFLVWETLVFSAHFSAVAVDCASVFCHRDNSKKMQKREFRSDPVYTNPVKNFLIKVGQRLMGETKWEKGVETASCDFLRSCGFLRFSAVFCGSKLLTLQIKDQICKKICENLRQTAVSPFWSLPLSPPRKNLLKRNSAELWEPNPAFQTLQILLPIARALSMGSAVDGAGFPPATSKEKSLAIAQERVEISAFQKKITIAEKSLRCQIAKYKIASFSAEIAENRQKIAEKNIWAAEKNRSVSIFLNPQHFRDAKVEIRNSGVC